MSPFVFDTNSSWYTKALVLRDNVLRKPLGLSLSKDDTAADHMSLHFGIADNDTLVACVILQPKDQHRYKLRQMAIAPSQQKTGLGTSIVKFAEQVIMKSGAKQIELHARLQAEPFYVRLGYRTHNEAFVEQGIPHLYMSKVLIHPPLLQPQ